MTATAERPDAWTNAPGCLEPRTGQERWRDPHGELHLINEVLTGVVPH